MEVTSDITLRKIYDIINGIYKWEEIINSENNKRAYYKQISGKIEKGYLIEKTIFEGFKGHIHYNDLKVCISKTFDKVKSNIKKIFPNKKGINYINPTYFNNSESLKNDLINKNNCYYLINENLISIIFQRNSNKNKILEKKEIYYTIMQDKIIIYFSLKDKNTNYLLVKINNGIIEKSSLLEKIENNNNNKHRIIISNEQKKEDNLNSDLIDKFKNKYKKHIEILIRLYIFYRNLKEKENIVFSDLKEEKKESHFIININWMKQFKLFFEYDDLKLYLRQLDNNSHLKSEEKIINDIIINLPLDYINKIINNNRSEVNQKVDDLIIANYSIKMCKYKSNLKYFKNYQIINKKINLLLMSLEYDLTPIQIDLYFIGNDKIFITFPNQKICDEIGFINEQNHFIPEYILNYTNDLKIASLNFFFKNSFNKENKFKHKFILNDNSHPFGYCYSLMDEDGNLINKNNEQRQKDNSLLKVESNDEDNNINEKRKDSKINSEYNSNDLNAFKEESLDQLLKRNKNSKNFNHLKKHSNMNNQINEETNEKKIKSIIQIILLIYKYEKELYNKIKESLNNTQINKIEKCILLKKKWVDLFITIHSNDEIDNYLKNNISDDIIVNINYIYSNIIKDKKEYLDNIKKADLTLSLNDFIDFTPEKLHHLGKNKDVYYPKNFYLINQNIYSNLMNIYETDNSKEEYNEKKINIIEYIINNGKILFSYKYELNSSDDNDKIKFFNILICEKSINSNEIDVISIHCFENDEEKCNKEFNGYKENKISSIDLSESKDGNIFVKKIVKENIFGEEEEKEGDNMDKNMIKLTSFNERQIKALIFYYFFIQDLKCDIQKKNNNNLFITHDCYLINYIWMHNFKNFYFYNELINIIKNITGTNIYLNEQNMEKIILEKLPPEYIKKINDKEEDYNEEFFEKLKNAHFNLTNFENKIRYPKNCELINAKIYSLIQQRKNIKLDLIKKSYIIKSNKIILEYISKTNSYIELLIGYFDFEKYQFIPEKILAYEEEKILHIHFNLLQSNSLKDFITFYTNKDKIMEKEIQIGNIYTIYKKENKEQIENKEIKEQNEYLNNIITKGNINNIIYLFKLHFFIKLMNHELNNDESHNYIEKKCYLIKKELIDKYIDFYGFSFEIKRFEENIFKELNKDTLIEIVYSEREDLKKFYAPLIKKYPKKYITKDNSSFNYELKMNQNYFKVDPVQYGDENFLCYENFIISLEPLDENQNITEFKYIIIHDKILLIFNDIFNIGFLDEKNNIFIPEIIVKYENRDDYEQMIQIIINQGIKKFESDFIKYFANSNNFMNVIRSNKSIEKTDIKINNYLGKKPFNNNNNDKPRILKPFLEKNNMESLINVLSAMLDTEIIKKKVSKSLKGNKEEKFYLLSYTWFKEYIKANNLFEIYDYLINNKIIESFMNKNIEKKEIQKKEIIIEIIDNLDKNLTNKIYEVKNYISGLSNNDLDFSYLIKAKNEFLVYYKEFILISSETNNLFLKALSKYFEFKTKSFPILLGDEKIFIEIHTTSKNMIEIGYLEENNIFQPIMFLEFENYDYFEMNIQMLKINGFNQYQNYFLLFNEDYISPIFDRNNFSIGRAYRYDISIKDYSKYISKENYMKSLVQLYLSNYALKTKFDDEIKIRQYFIINENYLQQLDNYTLIEKELNQINIYKECDDIINQGYDLNKVSEGKKVEILIKKILSGNDNNNKIESTVTEISSLLPWSYNKIDIFYYNNFKLLDISLFENLEKNEIHLYNNLNDNIVKCLIIETYILIDITNNNKNDQYDYILELCQLDKENKIMPVYFLAFYKEKYLSKYIKYIYSSLQINFNSFLESIKYSQGNTIKLEIDNEFEVGNLYKIFDIKPNENQFINNNSDNISINKSNINNNNQNIININKDDKKDYSIEKEITIHPSIGLKNVGATCYMNATLQCFCNLKQFINYFKYKLKKETIDKFKSQRKPNLTLSFKYLIENLWQTNFNKYVIKEYNKKNNNNKYYVPELFKETISDMNPLFEGEQANDAKDLVNFIIMTLHEELNKAPKNNNINCSNPLINQSNREVVLSFFMESFIKENISLISDLFYAMSDNVTLCLNCNNYKYSFQIYFFLNFPLEEVRRYKIQNQINQFIHNNQNVMYMNPILYQHNLNIFKNNCQNINSVNLDDCFRYNQKIEEFTGENSMFCNNCQKQCSAQYKTVLSTAPEILIIVLNRGKGIQYKVKCEFVLQLNLYEFLEMPNTGYMFDLVGVVTHMGESGASGHFIAYCKSPIDSNWYQYNDDLVFQVNNFANEVINYAMPYILFYQKIK